MPDKRRKCVQRDWGKEMRSWKGLEGQGRAEGGEREGTERQVTKIVKKERKERRLKVRRRSFLIASGN